MSWITETTPDTADGELARIYARLLEQRGKIANILQVQSLNPAALQNHVDLYMTLMFGESGLSRAEREAIAVVVSSTNDCEYCVAHHVEALTRLGGSEQPDADTLQTLSSADNLDALEPRLGNIVMHAEKLTSAPGAMTESDLLDLRAVGLSDRDILDLTLIVGYFNFVNRIAVGLGVTTDGNETSGYRDSP
ncbi:MAG: peroxidase-related enzyme [Woeseiaceae bacterium]|nr:peroxidase-related enzyme [Woeseiaceae bacterium]